MWPFKKKAKQPEPIIKEEEPPQNIELKVTFDPVANKLIMKPEEPEPLEKRPEPPKEMKWECPTCKKALPERATRSRFKCPHCRNWVYFLDKNLVTEEERARHWEEQARRWEEKDRVQAKEEIKQLHKQMKEEIIRYARETEFVAGMRIECQADSCEVCKRIAGKYTFKQGIPLVPIVGCTHERGCNCIFSPYVEDL